MNIDATAAPVAVNGKCKAKRNSGRTNALPLSTQFHIILISQKYAKFSTKPNKFRDSPIGG
jgi:hypothetical protein